MPVDRRNDVSNLLNHLMDDIDPGVVSQRTLPELRDVRDRCQQVEAGLSFGRRMVQGRLDIVMLEVERRSTGGSTSTEELMGRLPAVLAQHTRGGGTPRPVRDEELPAFTEELSLELDRMVAPSDIGRLSELDGEHIDRMIDQLQALERRVSAKRHELHRVIDELQEEIVSRYRSGAASVDDLLR